MTAFQVTPELVSKILDTVDAGLVKGLGEAQPGKMCIEAAVCYAMGLPHSDEPTCVGYAVRSFKIILNDSAWSSKQARAAGMRKLAVAQLGSNTIDQNKFSEELSFLTIKQLLSEMFRDIAMIAPDHAEMWLLHAKACSKAVNLEAAFIACPAVTCSPAYVARYAAESTETGDKYLLLGAEIALQVLKDLKSPGCDFLYMCD